MTLNWRTEDGGIWNPYKNKAMLKNPRINELEAELETIFADLAYDAEWGDDEDECSDDCRCDTCGVEERCERCRMCDTCGPIHHLLLQLQQEFNREYAKYGITRSFLPDEEREAWK